MSRQHPVIRRDEAIRNAMLALFAVAMVGAVLVSPRPIWPTIRPAITAVRDIPQRGELANIGDFIGAYAVIMPKAEHPPLILQGMGAGSVKGGQRAVLPAAPVDRTPRLGYSYREITAFGLPLMAYPEFGHVAYRDEGAAYFAVPLDADALALLNKKAGTTLEAGWFFPVWKLWGLLYVLAIAGIIAFERAAARRRRDALGLI